MPITATFLADFEKFNAETEKAGAKILSFKDRADQAGGRLMDLGDRGLIAAPKFGTLSESMHAFDGALAAMGIHIGPEIKALGELGAASGATASSLGLVATAGLATAAFLGGWKLGGLIADWTTWDEKIQDVAERLLNWTDKGERAAAVTDVITLAVKHGAAASISYADAIKFEAKYEDELALARGRSGDAAHDSMVQEAALQKELREARSRGDIPALTHDIDLHILSQKELSTKYGLTTSAIQYFIDKLKATEAASKDAEKAQAELAKGWEQFYDWAADQEATRQAQLKLGFEAWRNEAKAIEQNSGVLDGLLRQAAMDAAVAEDDARNKAAGLNDELKNTPAAAEPAAAGLDKMGTSAQQTTSLLAGMSAELYNAIRAAQAADAGFNKDRPFSTLISGIQPRASGGPVSAGSSYLVGERGPELFTPSSSGTILPNVGRGGSVVVNNYITQPFGTPDQLARAIDTAVTTSLRRRGIRGPVGA